MPAIQLARLKIQTAQLADRFAEPRAFVRGLHELLDFYAERTYRPGQTGKPPPLLRAYNVPQPVLRQILKELDPLVAADRQAALALCDALWAENYYEFRLLAASLLGRIAPDPPQEILERLDAWAVPSTEMRLIHALFKHGLARFRAEYPEQYFHKIESWLFSSQRFAQHLGLQALLMLLSAGEFENLPVLFHLITPLVREAPPSLRPDLLDVIGALAERSPKEAAFFLRENLKITTDNPGTAWLARQSLPAFPADIQAGLRAALRERRE